MIEILALQDGKMIGYWYDCNWSRTGGITSVLWSLPVSLDVSAKTRVETVEEIKEEETGTSVEETTTTTAEKSFL